MKLIFQIVFKLRRVEYNSLGDDSKILGYVDLKDKLTISPDGKTFKINLGKVNGEQYRLIYRTTYKPGTTLHNNVKITSMKRVGKLMELIFRQISGGSGTGNFSK